MINQAIRSFIAIETPLAIQQKLAQISNQLQAQGANAVRWVAVKNMHLTLKFLGDATPDQLEKVKAALQKAGPMFSPFEIRYGGIGAFPNVHRPRVLWVGIDASQTLLDLQKTVDLETRSLGFPGEERPFSAHLTLGRVSQHASQTEWVAIGEALKAVRVGDLATVRVNDLCLFRSDLKPSGPVYSLLDRVELSKI